MRVIYSRVSGQCSPAIQECVQVKCVCFKLDDHGFCLRCGKLTYLMCLTCKYLWCPCTEEPRENISQQSMYTNTPIICMLRSFLRYPLKRYISSILFKIGIVWWFYLDNCNNKNQIFWCIEQYFTWKFIESKRACLSLFNARDSSFSIIRNLILFA